jgi:hypothetical protein
MDEKGVLSFSIRLAVGSRQLAIDMNYDNKHFGMVSTSTGASNETVFHYRQEGDVAWGLFESGSVRIGVFVATVNAVGVLDLRYAYVNTRGALLTGTSLSTPELLPDGRIRLREDFQFTSGDQAKGVSVVEELSIADRDLSVQSTVENPKSKFLYGGKRFASVANTPNGEVSGDTVFDYRQRGDVVWAIYEGGAIRKGTLVAVAGADGALDMRYQHVNMKGEIMTGECQSTPEALADGRIRLHEAWQWTSGDRSSGTSIVEEIR